MDLRSVAADAARTVEPAMARRSLRFDVEAPDRPVTVTGSEEALRRLMLILLDNALRYTDPGGWCGFVPPQTATRRPRLRWSIAGST